MFNKCLFFIDFKSAQWTCVQGFTSCACSSLIPGTDRKMKQRQQIPTNPFGVGWSVAQPSGMMRRVFVRYLATFAAGKQPLFNLRRPNLRGLSIHQGQLPIQSAGGYLHSPLSVVHRQLARGARGVAFEALCKTKAP